MGWFDNEEADRPKTGPSSPAPARPPARAAGPTNETGSGSTLGRQIHIDGNIVCDEDLTILGRVDGTIRANGTLVIAKEADVRAKIDGQRVMVHGKVDGNVHGTERVVLGQTARLAGNIEAPTLEIVEGAYFKGNVDMKAAKSEAKAAKQSGGGRAAEKPGGEASPRPGDSAKSTEARPKGAAMDEAGAAS